MYQDSCDSPGFALMPGDHHLRDVLHAGDQHLDQSGRSDISLRGGKDSQNQTSTECSVAATVTV